MIITAKFASTCPTCNQSIRAGERVDWEKGCKARHAACAGYTVTAGATPGSSSTMRSESAIACGGERTITVERVGRRSYLRGDTMAVRGLLRSGGCHWDSDAKGWWIGSAETADKLAAEARSAKAEKAPAKRITHCVGCGCSLDNWAQQRGIRFCSRDCVNDRRLGGQSGYINGQWHQGSDD